MTHLLYLAEMVLCLQDKAIASCHRRLAGLEFDVHQEEDHTAGT